MMKNNIDRVDIGPCRPRIPPPSVWLKIPQTCYVDCGMAPVGVNWVNNYVGRTPAVQIAQSKKYDYQRAEREDPEVIKEHFQLFKNVANKYGILNQDDDIYNMDEIGFSKEVTLVTAKACDGKRCP